MNRNDSMKMTRPWFPRIARRVALVATVALAAVASAQGTGIPVATVNGVIITQAKLQTSLDAFMRQRRTGAGGVFDPDHYNKTRKRVLDVLIAQELLWQQASERGLVADDEEVQEELARVRAGYRTEGKFLAKIREGGFDEAGYAEDVKRRLSVRKLIAADIAPAVSVSDAEVHEFYTANPERFVRPEEVHARHILVKVAEDADEATRQAARKRIDAIHAEATGGGDFAELARQRSEGPSAPRGGDLGFFGRGRMAKPFEDAAFALAPGAISGPVQTRFGYHVIKVEARRGGDMVAEDEGREQIRAYLHGGKVDQAVAERALALREAGTVEVRASP
jgi:parvulin-like peptidyl-prolyl isomerase